MSSQPISTSYPIFHDLDGDPLETGYIYIGTAGLAASSNQISVYWDDALSTSATQPIRTSGGYPMLNGSPGKLFVAAGDYSLRVSDRNDSQIYTNLNAGRDAGRTFKSTLTGGTTRYINDKLAETVSVKDFGATGDGTTNDTVAIQAAITAVANTSYATASAPISIYFPAGIYNINTSITHTGDYIKLHGDGYKSAIKWSGANDINMFNFTGLLGGGLMVEDMSFDLQGLTCTAFKTSGFGHQVTFRRIKFLNSIAPSSGGASVLDMFVETHNGRIEQCWFLDCASKAIGLNRSVNNGAPVNWVIDNNEFQAINELCVFSVNCANIMISSNTIDNAGTDTLSSGFQVDGAIQVYFVNNYAESLAKFMFGISQATPNDATKSCSAIITGNTGVSCGRTTYTDVMLGATFESRDVQIYGNTWIGSGDWLTVGAAAKRTKIGHNVYATDLVGTIVEQEDGITGTGEWSTDGQYLSSTLVSGSAVSLTTGTAANVTSKVLTAGDWDVTGYVEFSGNAATTAAWLQASISEVSATMGTANTITSIGGLSGTIFSIVNYSMNSPTVRITVASGATTTVYLIGRASFAVNTLSAFGKIQARLGKPKVS